MDRFKVYLDKKVNHEHVKNSKQLEQFHIRCRFMPDPPDFFDEYEFGIDFIRDQDMGFAVTIEHGDVKRMLFGATDPENPDILKPLSDEELNSLLDKRGDDLIKFFDFITV